mmetsp:Transcript_14719/g.35739  ORF Transcript_14719/g.35739 Transcript_14719/m.35739 type:complete len:374 (+) Transcript_14719:523-1644(+)
MRGLGSLLGNKVLGHVDPLLGEAGKEVHLQSLPLAQRLKLCLFALTPVAQLLLVICLRLLARDLKLLLIDGQLRTLALRGVAGLHVKVALALLCHRCLKAQLCGILSRVVVHLLQVGRRLEAAVDYFVNAHPNSWGTLRENGEGDQLTECGGLCEHLFIRPRRCPCHNIRRKCIDHVTRWVLSGVEHAVKVGDSPEHHERNGHGRIIGGASALHIHVELLGGEVELGEVQCLWLLISELAIGGLPVPGELMDPLGRVWEEECWTSHHAAFHLRVESGRSTGLGRGCRAWAAGGHLWRQFPVDHEGFKVLEGDAFLHAQAPVVYWIHVHDYGSSTVLLFPRQVVDHEVLALVGSVAIEEAHVAHEDVAPPRAND